MTTQHEKKTQMSDCRASRTGIRCVAPRYGGTTCTYSKSDDNKYCVYHQYMLNYSEDQLKNLTECSGCHHLYYGLNGKQCDTCRTRVKESSPIKKKKGDACKVYECTYYANTEKHTDEMYKDYCVKHQLYAWAQEQNEKGNKVCSNYNRKCKTILPDGHKTKKCTVCLEKEKIKDRARVAKKVAHANEKNKLLNKQGDISDVDVVTKKCCQRCLGEYAMELFIGKDGNEKKECQKCRDKQNIADMKRKDNPQRIISKQEYEKKPETKTMRKEWSEKNPDKRAEIDLRHKAKLRQDPDYHKRLRENAKLYRNNNPEKVAMQSIKQTTTFEGRKYYYQQSAHTRGVKFILTDDQCNKLFYSNCYYCNQKAQNKQMNGIDRYDNDGDYVYNNCVSCCTMCNMIKGEIHGDHFFMQAEHIISGLYITSEFVTYPKVFYDYGGESYSGYVCRVNNKNKKMEQQMLDAMYMTMIENETVEQFAARISNTYDEIDNNKMVFELSRDEFYKIKCLPCYLCGKKMSLTHGNGIDRIDNKLGYLIGNVAPCCATCNYLKRDYNLVEFLEKLYHIYCNYTRKPIIFNRYNIEICVSCMCHFVNKQILSIISEDMTVETCVKKYRTNCESIKLPEKKNNREKISKVARQENNKVRLTEQRTKTDAKYADPNWIKTHAKELGEKKHAKVLASKH